MNADKARFEAEMAKAQIRLEMEMTKMRLGLGDLGVRPLNYSYLESANPFKPRGMVKHCVSCGAPPETTTTVCSYCGTQEKQ